MIKLVFSPHSLNSIVPDGSVIVKIFRLLVGETRMFVVCKRHVKWNYYINYKLFTYWTRISYFSTSSKEIQCSTWWINYLRLLKTFNNIPSQLTVMKMYECKGVRFNLFTISSGIFTWQSKNMEKLNPNCVQLFQCNKYTVFTMGDTVGLWSVNKYFFEELQFCN